MSYNDDLVSHRFKRRVIRVFQHYESTKNERGAMKWFAEQIGVSKRTVWAWCNTNDRRLPTAPALLLLRRLELEMPNRKTSRGKV